MPLDLDNGSILIPCNYCDEYDPDEATIQTPDGDIWCMGCYYDQYCESCRLCDAPTDPDEIDEAIVLIAEAMPGMPDDVGPGIYHVLQTPFYCQPLIGRGWLYSDALQKLRDIEPLDDGDAPYGRLCERCKEAYGIDTQ